MSTSFFNFFSDILFLYRCTIIIIQLYQSNKFIFLVLTMNIICTQIWTNRTCVPLLYCTTISKHTFGGGYLKLKISFYFFKNAKADSPTHTLQFETTHKNTSPSPTTSIPVHTYLSHKLPSPNHLSYPLS